jgi:hypothetical protein
MPVVLWSRLVVLPQAKGRRVHAIIMLVTLDRDMNLCRPGFLFSAAILFLALLLPDTASAFRCGNKLVKEGMHEVEVIAICGEPTTVRSLGYAIRSVEIHDRRLRTPGWAVARGSYYSYPVEVLVTEYVYNLGPRKFMRRVLFETARWRL